MLMLIGRGSERETASLGEFLGKPSLDAGGQTMAKFWLCRICTRYASACPSLLYLVWIHLSRSLVPQHAETIDGGLLPGCFWAWSKILSSARLHHIVSQSCHVLNSGWGCSIRTRELDPACLMADDECEYMHRSGPESGCPPSHLPPSPLFKQLNVRACIAFCLSSILFPDIEFYLFWNINSLQPVGRRRSRTCSLSRSCNLRQSEYRSCSAPIALENNMCSYVGIYA